MSAIHAPDLYHRARWLVELLQRCASAARVAVKGVHAPLETTGLCVPIMVRQDLVNGNKLSVPGTLQAERCHTECACLEGAWPPPRGCGDAARSTSEGLCQVLTGPAGDAQARTGIFVARS